MSPATIRRATEGDSTAIASVHLQCWRETYAPVLPAEFLASMDLAARAARWAEVLRAGRAEVHVALVRGQAVGFASSGLGRHEDRPAPHELEGLYLLAERHGTGDGSRLMAAAIADRPAYLWVWRDNARAFAFYTRRGFSRDGATDVHSIGGYSIPVTRMVRVSQSGVVR